MALDEQLHCDYEMNLDEGDCSEGVGSGRKRKRRPSVELSTSRGTWGNGKRSGRRIESASGRGSGSGNGSPHPGEVVFGSDRREEVSSPVHLFLLDFGLCRGFRDVATGQVKKERTRNEFRGTKLYASVHAHRQRDLGRRDDMWSLFYAFVVLLKVCTVTELPLFFLIDFPVVYFFSSHPLLFLFLSSRIASTKKPFHSATLYLYTPYAGATPPMVSRGQ